MPMTTCPPGEWTTIPAPASGDMLLEARGIGFYVSTAATPPTNPAEGYALASNESMVIASGQTVNVQPAQPVKSVVAYSEGV